MTVANAVRAFFTALNGSVPTGKTVAEVIQNGTNGVSLGNTTVVKYEDDGKSIVLNSSTASSTKKFKITVVDDGTITATEVVTSGE